MSDPGLQPAPAWVRLAGNVIQRLPAARYRAMNWIGRRRTEPFWAEMPADLGRLRFRCDLRDPLMREVCRAASGRLAPSAFLKPLEDVRDLGEWPHLLWTRQGFRRDHL